MIRRALHIMAFAVMLLSAKFSFASPVELDIPISNKFAIIAKGNYYPNYPNFVIGRVGASTYDSEFAIPDSIILNDDDQLADLFSEQSTFRDYLKNYDTQTTISTLDEMTFTEGVYFINGDAFASALNINFSGDEDDIIVINIDGNLGLDAVTFELGGVNPANIFWNVTGTINLYDYTQAFGVFISYSNINVYYNVVGTMSLWAEGDVFVDFTSEIMSRYAIDNNLNPIVAPSTCSINANELNKTNLVSNARFQATPVISATANGFNTNFSHPSTSPTALLPGQYGIGFNTSIWNTYWAAFKDNSGDGSRMLIVDGYTKSIGSDRIIWENTIEIVGGRKYVFSFLVANPNKGDDNHYVVKIDGNLLGTYTTTPNSPWQLICVEWTATGSGSRNVYAQIIQDYARMNNGTFGNDYLFDNIVFYDADDNCADLEYFESAYTIPVSPINIEMKKQSENFVYSIVDKKREYQYVDIRIETIPEQTGTYGNLEPNWSLKTSTVVTGGSTMTLNNGTYNFPIVSVFNQTFYENKNYYWRIRTRYYNSNTDEVILYSELAKFILVPNDLVVPAASYLASAHTNAINWIYSVSYGDVNETKEEMSYIDGLGKPRQLQNKNNTNNEIIAIEIAYSEEGGGSVVSLPAPIPKYAGTTGRFGYSASFFDVKHDLPDAPDLLSDFQTRDFDRLQYNPTATKYRIMTSTPLDQTVAGTVGYYYGSGQSNNRIDDAEGYAYSYNVPYASPVQRPWLVSGGAGKVFSIKGGRQVYSGDDVGREYEYLFANPSAIELQRIYGKSSTIDPKTISKQTVYDPNGIGNITYTDNEGKVIATALTACNVSSLTALDESGTSDFKVTVNPLLTDAMYGYLEKVAYATFEIPCGTVPVDFKYSRKNIGFNPINGGPCLACEYDLEITIVNNKTKELVYSKKETITPLTSSVCAESTPTEAPGTVVSETINLDGPATYTVVRSIRPRLNTITGKTIFDELTQQFSDEINTDEGGVYFNQFESEVNVKDEYFVLRKTYSGINNIPQMGSEICYDACTIKDDNGQCDNNDLSSSALWNNPKGLVWGFTSQYHYSVIAANAGDHSISYLMTDNLSTGLQKMVGNGVGYEDGNFTIAKFDNPVDVAIVNSRNIIVCDQENDVLRRVELNVSPVVDEVFTLGGADSLEAPSGIGVIKNTGENFATDYKVFVASTGNHKIFSIDQSGDIDLIAGKQISGSVDGLIGSATFNAPLDVAVDLKGNLYVITSDHLLRKIHIDPSNNTYTHVTTLAGSSGISATVDGDASTARFKTMSSVDVDEAGNVYITESNGHVVRKYNAFTGYVSTIAGGNGTGSTGFVNAEGTSTLFNTPTGIFTYNGNVLVMDATNKAVRRLNLKKCQNGASAVAKEYLDYVDQVTIIPLTSGHKIIDLDGNKPGPLLLPGQEEYTITSYTNIGSPGSTITNNFIQAYKRMHHVDLTSKINSISLFDVVGGFSPDEHMKVIGDDKELNASDLKQFYLLKVNYSGLSCEEKCEQPVVTDDCENQCTELQNAYHAELSAMMSQLELDQTPLTYDGEIYSIASYIYRYYPLSAEMLEDLSDEHLKLYIDYESALLKFSNFDYSSCVSLCNNELPTQCEICVADYKISVNEKVDELFQGYKVLMDKWQQNITNNVNATNAYFPYELSDLIETINSVDYHNIDLKQELGEALFNLALSIASDYGSNAAYLVKASWETNPSSGIGCGICNAPDDNACEVSSELFIPLLPEILQSTLEGSLLEAKNNYFTCLLPNGQSAAMCDSQIVWCIRSLGDPESDFYTSGEGEGTYSTRLDECNEMECNTLDVLYRKAMIRDVLYRIYNKPLDEEYVQTLVGDIYVLTEGMSLAQLSDYLLDYEYHQQCIVDCQASLIKAFNEWKIKKITEYRNALIDSYVANCYGNMDESMALKYDMNIYHYTLYNYDYGNNLISTVPPLGIDYVDVNSSDPLVANKVPVHYMKTLYEPSSLYRLSTTSPDAGKTEYLYDKAGRVRFSQNADQKLRSDDNLEVIFSYTKYDEEGRIIESGEHASSLEIIPISLNGFNRVGSGGLYASDKVDDYDWPTANTNEETYVQYDVPQLSGYSLTQNYLDQRISKTYNDNGATYYSYDVHGRVNFVVQEINGLGSTYKYKSTEYSYGALTGKVEFIDYQRFSPQDRFRHRYIYDADIRLIDVDINRTSSNSNWTQAVAYTYYRHGPLEKTIYGAGIQQMDYVYNVNGWLKAINYPDPDDPAANQVQTNADVFAEVLHYYRGDFARSGAYDNTNQVTPQSGQAIYDRYKDLYNGNIAATVSFTDWNKVGATTVNPVMAQTYEYDYLNRLKGVYNEVYSAVTTSFSGLNGSALGNNSYASEITYDANGNILSMVQNTGNRTYVNGNSVSVTSAAMDHLTYRYEVDGGGLRTNNRLKHVNDAVLASLDEPAYTGDIKDQGSYSPSSPNYGYDSKGRLIQDLAHNIELITWTAYDKVKRIYRNGGKPDIEFTYDSKQQRLSKKVYYSSNAVTHYYVYDASGKLMATYKYYNESSTWKYKVEDLPVYGRKREGQFKLNEVLIPDPDLFNIATNKLYFEITDHLGSVRAVVLGALSTGSVQVVKLTDYLAFGASMQGRDYIVPDAYRFGYQGSEQEGELYDGGAYTTEYRMLDVRLGRWFSTDPVTQPWQSPYCSMDNNPIWFKDPLGDTVSYATFRDRINLGISRLFSKEFRKEFKVLDASRNNYKYRRFEKGGLGGKTLGQIELVSTNENGSMNFEIQYERTDQNPGAGTGRSALHAIFEETFHAVDFELNRSTSMISDPDSEGRQYLGHLAGDRNHEARAWNFAANNAPFPRSLNRVTYPDGTAANITKTLVQQIRNLHSDPQSPNPQIAKWLYEGYSVDINRIAPTPSEVQSVNRPPLY